MRLHSFILYHSTTSLIFLSSRIQLSSKLLRVQRHRACRLQETLIGIHHKPSTDLTLTDVPAPQYLCHYDEHLHAYTDIELVNIRTPLSSASLQIERRPRSHSFSCPSIYSTLHHNNLTGPRISPCSSAKDHFRQLDHESSANLTTTISDVPQHLCCHVRIFSRLYRHRACRLQRITLISLISTRAQVLPPHRC